jgi:hypothetical protein
MKKFYTRNTYHAPLKDSTRYKAINALSRAGTT